MKLNWNQKNFIVGYSILTAPFAAPSVGVSQREHNKCNSLNKFKGFVSYIFTSLFYVFKREHFFKKKINVFISFQNLFSFLR